MAEWDYGHIFPRKPGVCPPVESIAKQCDKCGAAFTTGCRTCELCLGCRAIRDAANQKKANERLKAKRAARKAMRIHV